MDLNIVVLAAGQGTRMKSSCPKVLHPIGNQPMLGHVLETAQTLKASQLTVVVGVGEDLIKKEFSQRPITWVSQTTPKGTGDAVTKALPVISPKQDVLILYGDVPLISAKTLSNLISATEENAIGMVTVNTFAPTGLGRIVRDQSGRVTKIVEERDATETERKISEINTGIYFVKGQLLHQFLPKLSANNNQGELYLTDIIEMAVQSGISIQTVQPVDPFEVMGINDRFQQAMLERYYQRMQAQHLMHQGVTILDPERFDLRGTLKAGMDVKIDVNAIFEGENVIGNGSEIGSNCVLINCEIGEGVTILSNSYLENAKIGNHSKIGPFARIRPGTVVQENVRVGNFVEIKNSIVDDNSKINHLSYIGDATIGKNVNIGAGTITCNYDGANKHRTIIEDGAQIGSDTQLIAPVKVGKSAMVAAGSTLKQNAPENKLTVTHKLEQRHRDWQKPVKNKDTENQI